MSAVHARDHMALLAMKRERLAPALSYRLFFPTKAALVGGKEPWPLGDESCRELQHFPSRIVAGPERIIECRWQQFFANPSQWWDHRSDETTARYPDFTHKNAQDGLWIRGKINGLLRFISEEINLSTTRLVSRTTGIHRYAAPSQARTLCSGRDEGQDAERVTGKEGCREGTKDELVVETSTGGLDEEQDPERSKTEGLRESIIADEDVVETSGSRFPGYDPVQGKKLQDRYSRGGKGWPWVSVIPSEATGFYVGRRGKSRGIGKELSSSPRPKVEGSSQQPSESLFPLIHRDPSVGTLLNLLPRSVPDRICTSLNKYGWSAHIILELRTMIAQGTKLKPRQILDVLSRQRDAEVAYNFLEWALEEVNCRLDIKCFTVVLLLVGRVRKYDLLEKLLEDLDRRGYRMDKIIFTAAMRCYADGQRMQEALELFVKMKERGFKPDCVTYSVLMQMFSKAKLYQEALKLYEEMIAQGVATDTQVYNCVVSTFGKAGRLDLGYEKLEEMRERGHIPDQFTYGVLLEGYAKAGRPDFMDLYREMQSAGIPVNEVIFNIMFSGIEHIGTLNDAEGLFADMERVGLAANLNAFATLIGMCSKKGDAAGAQRWFDKMASMGLHPTLAVGNSLLDGYARAKQFNQAKQVLDSFQKWGITPNLPTLTVCLRSLSLCEKPDDFKIVQRMLSCHIGSQFLSHLLDRSAEKKNLAPVIASFLGSLYFERRQNRRVFVDVLIDYLYKTGRRSQAYLVWEGALSNYVFPGLVEQGPEGICSLNLRGMECGTAIIALTNTLPLLNKQFHRKEMTPEWVQIYTVHVIEEVPMRDPTSVHHSVDLLLQTLRSPFHSGTLQTGGGFVCRGEDVMHWLDEPEIRAMLAFKH